MTLNGVMAVNLRYSAECIRLYNKLRQMVEARSILPATIMQPRECSFLQYMIYGDIRKDY